jgi:hypothetical protein
MIREESSTHFLADMIAIPVWMHFLRDLQIPACLVCTAQPFVWGTASSIWCNPRHSLIFRNRVKLSEEGIYL